MSSDLGITVLELVIIHTHTDCALVELGRHAAQRTVKTFILINVKKKRNFGVPAAVLLLPGESSSGNDGGGDDYGGNGGGDEW